MVGPGLRVLVVPAFSEGERALGLLPVLVFLQLLPELLVVGEQHSIGLEELVVVGLEADAAGQFGTHADGVALGEGCGWVGWGEVGLLASASCWFHRIVYHRYSQAA